MRSLVLIAALVVSPLAWGQLPTRDHIQLESVAGSPGSITNSRVFIDNRDELAGFQLALNYDPSQVQLVDLQLSGLTLGAELIITSDTVNPGEFAVAVLVDYLPPFSRPPIAPGIQQEIATTVWELSPSVTEGQIIPLNVVSGAGDPVVETLFALDSGFSVYPTRGSGEIAVTILNSFVRGDYDADAQVEMEDAIGLLNYMFQSGTPPVCDDACDANDDASLDLFDVVYILQYLFSSGASPLAPFPSPGVDPTSGDGLGCDGDVDDPQ